MNKIYLLSFISNNNFSLSCTALEITEDEITDQFYSDNIGSREREIDEIYQNFADREFDFV